jgi:hypothetical protein
MTARAALALPSPLAAVTPRVAAFLLALAALALPDCCLTGRHAVGFDMGILAPICHAAR